MVDEEIHCSNEGCNAVITRRQADISEIFIGRGKPLCENCYAKKIHADRSDEWKKKVDGWNKERAALKAASEGSIP